MGLVEVRLSKETKRIKNTLTFMKANTYNLKIYFMMILIIFVTIYYDIAILF
jgi:hypothetical protein